MRAHLSCRAIVTGAPPLRQPFISRPTLAAASVIADLGPVNLGVRPGSLYGTRIVVANGYGNGNMS